MSAENVVQIPQPSPALPLRQFPYAVPRGEAGVLETVRRMGEIIWHLSHSARLARFARDLIEGAGIAAYDGRGETKALFDFVQQNIRYTRDPFGYEWVQSVVPTLVTGHGDCDCHAVLLGSLLMSVGYPVRLVIAGSEPGKFHHVFLQAQYRTPEGIPVWVYLDTTIPGGEGFDWNPHFSVLRAFAIKPQGELEEVSAMRPVSVQSVGYGLGDYLAEIAAPQHTVTFHLSTGKSVSLPWSAQDLKFVSDAELRGWILSEFGPEKGQYTEAELAELIGIVGRLDTLPEIQALGFGDDQLGGFWKKLGKGLKSTFKAVGKGIKKAVGSIPVIGKPIVGIAAGVKDIVKAPFTGVKAALAPSPNLLLLQQQAMAKAQQQATTKLKSASERAIARALGPASADASEAAPATSISRRRSARSSSAATAAEAAAPAKASVEITPGAAPAVPEVKAQGRKNLLLAAGGAAALGAGAYAYVKSQD